MVAILIKPRAQNI